MSYKYCRTDKGKLKLHCWSNRNSVKPWEVPLYTTSKYWFDCDECNSEFEIPLTHLVICGNWCHKCYPNKQIPKLDYTRIFGPSFAGFT